MSETDPHPYYGPCDALGPERECGECEKQGVPGLSAGRAGGPADLSRSASQPFGRSSLTQSWLLIKRGLYWRPDAQGYTGLKCEAGRYTEELAKAWADPPRGETTAIREEDAPRFAPNCSMDIRSKHLEQENMRLRRYLFEMIRADWTLPSSYKNAAREALEPCVSDEHPVGEDAKGEPQ